MSSTYILTYILKFCLLFVYPFKNMMLLYHHLICKFMCTMMTIDNMVLNLNYFDSSILVETVRLFY